VIRLRMSKRIRQKSHACYLHTSSVRAAGPPPWSFSQSMCWRVYLVARNHLAARKSNGFRRHWVLFHL
jgi:hypothetical protein